MTAREIEMAMRAGNPFVVYGEAIWFDPKQYPGEWPHSVYRRLMGNGDIAVEVESAQEHGTRVPGLTPRPADRLRWYNRARRIVLLASASKHSH